MISKLIQVSHSFCVYQIRQNVQVVQKVTVKRIFKKKGEGGILKIILPIIFNN